MESSGTGFVGRSLNVINDLSIAERKYLFGQSRVLKQALAEGNSEVVEQFRLNRPDLGVYQLFLEDSTRTLESFRNAAFFHRVALKVFQGGQSSLNKSESFSDTFQTLIGYDNRIFIVRSYHEGLCRWLEKSARAYVERSGLSFMPSFVNAGDGQHEHPTQELLDDFSFLEQNQWDYSRIHVALIGDLLHSRTIHSKIDGLRIFDEVCLDLIAPEDLSLRPSYLGRMESYGYRVRCFSSLTDYLEQGELAPIWYFTRLQMERMGELMQRRAEALRRSVTCTPELAARVPDYCRFYHPLPRDKRYPVIPTFLDQTQFNRWEEQSRNGRIIRMVLLAMLGGRIGTDFPRPIAPGVQTNQSCYVHRPFSPHAPKRVAEGIKPLKNGLVLDHICRGAEPETIRRHMARIIRVLGLQEGGGEWVSRSKKSEELYKGLIFRPSITQVNEDDLRRLATVAPGATVNIIVNSNVREKYRLTRPQHLYGFSQLRCCNSACISHPHHLESVDAEFRSDEKGGVYCLYCEQHWDFEEIWGDSCSTT